MAYNYYYVLILAIFFSCVNAAKNTKTTSICVFGDSTVDVGNNDYLPAQAPKANFPHYGIDYPHGVSTGRFSNGLLGIDYTAKGLGFQMSPPPSLSRPINDMQFMKGVNFASAGSGILNTTGKDVLTLAAQINLFKEYVSQINARMGKKAAEKYLANSLIYLSTGSNDLFALYSSNAPNITLRDQIVTSLTNIFQQQLKEIYDLGARKFAIAGTGLIGCIPGIRVLSPTYDCNPALNDISLHFKISINKMLKDLSLKLEGFKFSFGDSYEYGLYVAKNLSLLGFTETEAACCGSGKLQAQVMCAPNTTYCANRSQYTSWDAIHPTQALYKLIAQTFLKGSKFVNPVNIYQLMCS